MSTWNERLLNVAGLYADATGAKLSMIAKDILKDSAFFSDLASGRNCRTDTFDKVLLWLSERWPDDTEWPSDVPRPVVREAAE